MRRITSYLFAFVAIATVATGCDGDRPTEALTVEIRESLQDNLLAAWYPRSVDTVHGGFLSDFDADWNPVGEQDKMIVTQARHVWTTARAAAAFPDRRDEYLAISAQGAEFLADHMWDRENGGFHSLVTRAGEPMYGQGGAFTEDKTAYGNAFAIFGLAAYAESSGDAQALELAKRAFAWLDEHAHDAEHGGYRQFIARDDEEYPPKDQNSSIHILEAFTQLYRVWPDEVLRARTEEMLGLIRDTMVAEPGYLRLFFEDDWTHVSYRDSSESVRMANLEFDHVSFGHDVETAWLMLEAAEAIGVDPARTLAVGKAMVDHTIEHGFDESAGGIFDGALYDTGQEASPRIVMPGKTWWAQAEAANTFLVFADLFPTDEHDYFARFAETWEYIKQNLIDHERGGWYGSDVGDPKASIWKGPYHAGRALMNIAERLERVDRMDDGAADRTDDLMLAPLFTDGMVVQRGMPIPVIGTATPGATVRVGLAGRVAETHADESGRWVATLPAMEAGGPYRLDVASSDASISLEDVMVGDVWVASGQSNMEWTMADVRDAAAEAARATGGRIRHFKVPRSWSFAPEDGLAGGEWVKENPQSVAEFTAVGYFFARHLVEHEGVAIGLINTTWGGSRIEPWMSAEALGLGADEVQAIVDGESARAKEVEDRLSDKVGAGWLPIDVPGLWEAQGFDGMDGVATYRTTFELTEAEASASAGTGVRLGLGMIDDSDVTFVNDVEVGRMDWAWNQAREYDVPASALRVGENVVTVRVEDGGGGGGIYGAPELLFVETAGGARRPLDAEWTLRVDEITVTADDAKNQIATMLYNKMVHPLQKYPIRGVIWYQGESNADPQGSLEYADLFRGLITSWRREWGQGDFPFLWVQLANYMAPDSLPPETSSWAALRDAQTEALELPATGQALAIDIGETDDIHPRNKQDVGLRLALAARHVAYGDDEVVYSGPVYRSHRAEGGVIRVAFDHVGGGLVVGDGAAGAAVGDGDQALAGFAIAGSDGRYFWADARIEGGEVVVLSDNVAAPVAVRYAWGDNPIDANLYNREGLPATPFSRGQVVIRASPSAKSP